MITKAKILDMLEMQNSLEIRISGENWTKLGHDYKLAIFLECGEMVEHYGWKWWKAQERNMDQVCLELVDIWHFAMAWMITQSECNEDLAGDIHSALLESSNDIAKDDVKYSFCDLAASLGCYLYSSEIFSFSNFVRLCSECEMSFDGLYALYCSKNVLNRFRQDMGYADGTYAKEWGGREDNEHLFDIVNSMDSEVLSSTAMYTALAERYAHYTMH